MAYARNCLQLPTLLEKCVVYGMRNAMRDAISKGTRNAISKGMSRA